MHITESIDEILRSEHSLGARFYERFFKECPHLQTYFRGVDMDRQAILLTSAIVLVETIQSRKASGLGPYLQMLGRQHQARGISREDFTDWTESMLLTLAEFHGDRWSKSLECEWHQAISNVAQKMLEAYET
tara:strand:+ start:562196 stop:562591 length:396 start_codon:yes stop_codon:yes gene_type:complete